MKERAKAGETAEGKQEKRERMWRRREAGVGRRRETNEE